MNNTSFRDLFYIICEIRFYIVKLNGEDLYNFKKVFYNLDFPKWRLDLLWDLIWDDKSLDEVAHIFQSKKLI